jgi:Uma2 family endonuclease
MTDLAKGDRRRRPREVEYPTSDGKPMAETDRHVALILHAVAALRTHYAARPDVYVAGNNFLYYREGDPTARVSPDTYVVFGVPMRLRDSYKAWEEEGRLPDVVFEFTSRKTRSEDTGRKRELYERVLKVPEYFLFDPRGDYLNPRLQGYRLLEDGYVPLEPVEGRLYSERLRLELVQQGVGLRFFDPARGEWLPTHEEAATRAREAEEEVARLRAELDALRRQAGQE